MLVAERRALKEPLHTRYAVKLAALFFGVTRPRLAITEQEVAQALSLSHQILTIVALPMIVLIVITTDVLRRVPSGLQVLDAELGLALLGRAVPARAVEDLLDLRRISAVTLAVFLLIDELGEVKRAPSFVPRASALLETTLELASHGVAHHERLEQSRRAVPLAPDRLVVSPVKGLLRASS